MQHTELIMEDWILCLAVILMLSLTIFLKPAIMEKLVVFDLEIKYMVLTEAIQALQALQAQVALLAQQIQVSNNI